MWKRSISCLLCTLLLAACSPRDLLSRRLAADLISASAPLKVPQEFFIRTGILSNRDYLSPDSLVLLHRGWISANTAPCPVNFAPPPCWDVVLTPSGVDTVKFLVTPAEAEKPAFEGPAARRELVEITGISRQGNAADVEFTWKWMPLNEIGAALYSGDLRYRSTVEFRLYDDGWRLAQNSAHIGQSLDDAIKSAEPAQ